MGPLATTQQSMPTLVQPMMQRTLAAHTAAPQLLSSATPLGHEVRRDGGGVISSLLRPITGMDPADAEFHAGADLVLQRTTSAAARMPSGNPGPAITTRARMLPAVASSSPNPSLELQRVVSPGVQHAADRHSPGTTAEDRVLSTIRVDSSEPITTRSYVGTHADSSLISAPEISPYRVMAARTNSPVSMPQSLGDTDANQNFEALSIRGPTQANDQPTIAAIPTLIERIPETNMSPGSPLAPGAAPMSMPQRRPMAIELPPVSRISQRRSDSGPQPLPTRSDAPVADVTSPTASVVAPVKRTIGLGTPILRLPDTARAITSAFDAFDDIDDAAADFGVERPSSDHEMPRVRDPAVSFTSDMALRSSASVSPRPVEESSGVGAVMMSAGTPSPPIGDVTKDGDPTNANVRNDPFTVALPPREPMSLSPSVPTSVSLSTSLGASAPMPPRATPTPTAAVMGSREVKRSVADVAPTVSAIEPGTRSVVAVLRRSPLSVAPSDGRTEGTTTPASAARSSGVAGIAQRIPVTPWVGAGGTDVKVTGRGHSPYASVLSDSSAIGGNAVSLRRDVQRDSVDEMDVLPPPRQATQSEEIGSAVEQPTNSVFLRQGPQHDEQHQRPIPLIRHANRAGPASTTVLARTPASHAEPNSPLRAGHEGSPQFASFDALPVNRIFDAEGSGSASMSAINSSTFNSVGVQRQGDANGPAAPLAGPAVGGAELDALAHSLYERIRTRLRRELLDDRERAGFLLDRMR